MAYNGDRIHDVCVVELNTTLNTLAKDVPFPMFTMLPVISNGELNGDAGRFMATRPS